MSGPFGENAEVHVQVRKNCHHLHKKKQDRLKTSFKDCAGLLRRCSEFVLGCTSYSKTGSFGTKCWTKVIFCGNSVPLKVTTKRDCKPVPLQIHACQIIFYFMKDLLCASISLKKNLTRFEIYCIFAKMFFIFIFLTH